MPRNSLIAGVLMVAGTATLAHDGVKDADVMARMMAMSEISDASKAVGLMLRGQAAFDPAIVAQSAGTIAEESARIPALFESRADDPMSEALPAIWENWDDFQAKAQSAVTAAEALGTVTSEAELAPAFAAVGQTCRACHTDYRE